MRDLENTDDVFSALRTPATDAELRHESQVVELMAAAHPSTKGMSMTAATRFTSRRARVGTLIAAGVIGFGGVAAAGPGGFDPLSLGADEDQVEVDGTVPDDTAPEETVPEDAAPEDTVPEDTVPEETVPEDTAPEERASLAEEPDTAPLFVDNPDTTFDESTCLPGNHGKTVSAVARGESPFEDVEVRDAAQSDCGKQGLEEVDDESDAESVERVDGDRDDDDADRSDKPGRGNSGQGNPGNSGKDTSSGDGPGNSGSKGKKGK